VVCIIEGKGTQRLKVRFIPDNSQKRGTIAKPGKPWGCWGRKEEVWNWNSKQGTQEKTDVRGCSRKIIAGIAKAPLESGKLLAEVEEGKRLGNLPTIALAALYKEVSLCQSQKVLSGGGQNT